MKRILCILCLLSVVGMAAQNNKQAEKKVGIKEFFLMLPESAFSNDNGDFSLQNRKKMLKTIGQRTSVKNYNETYSYIDVCDPQNGYLSAFYDTLEGYKYQICYWNLKDGRKLVAINKHEGFGKLKFYLYEEGKLKDGSSYAPDINNIQMTDFFDTSRLNAKEKKNLQSIFKEKLVFQYVLPRKGKSIEMSVGSIPYHMDYETMFDEADLTGKYELKHIVFKWVNEKWVKEVHKGAGTNPAPY